MSHSRNRLLSLLLIVVLLGATAGLSACSLATAAPSEQGTVAAPEPAKETLDRSIIVLGRGRASGKPDVAQLNVGVETFAPTVSEATQQNATKMNAIMAKLKDLGIAEKDIQTSNYNISLERQGYSDSGQYRVSNMVQVKVREPEKLGSVLDALVQAGINQVWGVSFTLEDQSALEAEARTKAVEDARQRAEALAKLSGVELGDMLTFTESWSPGPVYSGGGGYGKGAADGSPVSPGEVEVVYQVQASFAIK